MIFVICYFLYSTFFPKMFNLLKNLSGLGQFTSAFSSRQKSTLSDTKIYPNKSNLLAICGRGNPLLINVYVRHGHLTCSTQSTMHNSPFERFPVRPTDHSGHGERIKTSRFLAFCGIFKLCFQERIQLTVICV